MYCAERPVYGILCSMKEKEELKRRVLDLANRCYQQNIYTFSGFLNVAEVSDVYAMERELDFVPWKLFGGTEGCERQMLRFGSEETLGYEEAFPISCVVIRPSAPKFAEELTHRDFLGALMNLGIERDVLGDIIVRGAVGYVFCEDAMADYLEKNITQVRHTTMTTEVTKECPRRRHRSLRKKSLSSVPIDVMLSFQKHTGCPGRKVRNYSGQEKYL